MKRVYAFAVCALLSAGCSINAPLISPQPCQGPFVVMCPRMEAAPVRLEAPETLSPLPSEGRQSAKTSAPPREAEEVTVPRLSPPAPTQSSYRPAMWRAVKP